MPGKTAAKKSPSKASKKGTGKRELIAPNEDKRYVKRDGEGKFKESDDVSKSLSQDAKKTAKTKVKPGYGDQGDQAPKKSPAKKATKSSKASAKTAAKPAAKKAAKKATKKA